MKKQTLNNILVVLFNIVVGSIITTEAFLWGNTTVVISTLLIIAVNTTVVLCKDDIIDINNVEIEELRKLANQLMNDNDELCKKQFTNNFEYKKWLQWYT